MRCNEGIVMMTAGSSKTKKENIEIVKERKKYDE
jgi:hypothetical protein